MEHAWPAPRWASLCGELYRAAKDSIAARYEYAPYDLGLHVAVADLDYLKQGHVSYLLPHLLAASMLNLDPRCRRVMLGVAYFG